MKIIKSYITVNGKKYFYTLEKINKEETFFRCKGTHIAQPFPDEDIPALLVDLPELIISEQEYYKNQKEIIRFRISAEDKKRIQKKAIKSGYNSVSSFLRDLGLGKA